MSPPSVPGVRLVSLAQGLDAGVAAPLEMDTWWCLTAPLDHGRFEKLEEPLANGLGVLAVSLGRDSAERALPGVGPPIGSYAQCGPDGFASSARGRLSVHGLQASEGTRSWSLAFVASPGAARPVRSPLMSATKTGTPAFDN
jgi:hypothetical protein